VLFVAAILLSGGLIVLRLRRVWSGGGRGAAWAAARPTDGLPARGRARNERRVDCCRRVSGFRPFL